MACLDMYNSEHNNNGSSTHHHHHHHNFAPSMSPRISFSNDFVDAQQALKQEIIRGSRSENNNNNNNNAPEVVSSDFEFSVTNYSMMSADELFFKGRLLPFKDNCNNNNQMQRVTTTLREELLMEDDDDEYYDGFSLRPPKGSSTKWKGFLGLRKSSHIGSKKVDKSEGSSYRGVESRRSGLINEGARLNVNSQELLNEGDSSCTDVEIGI